MWLWNLGTLPIGSRGCWCWARACCAGLSPRDDCSCLLNRRPGQDPTWNLRVLPGFTTLSHSLAICKRHPDVAFPSHMVPLIGQGEGNNLQAQTSRPIEPSINSWYVPGYLRQPTAVSVACPGHAQMRDIGCFASLSASPSTRP